MKNKVLAVDPGDKRIGLAISDELGVQPEAFALESVSWRCVRGY